MNLVDPSSTRPIAVLGAGTLGRRIALMFASRPGVVRVCDLSQDARDAAKSFIDEQLPAVLAANGPGAPANVEYTAEFASAVDGAWLVMESLPERIELKRQIFGELDQIAPPDALLATNSSSYRSSEMIGQVKRPERVFNLHFFMPPAVTACELMTCGHTDPAVFERLMRVLPSYGLTPFLARKESTGLIYNRIWAAIKRESLAVAAEGLAEAAEIDQLFTMVLHAPFGSFRLMDQVGLDVALEIEEHYAAVRPGVPAGPRQLLRRYIDEGRLGIKSGRGFYDYE